MIINIESIEPVLIDTRCKDEDNGQHPPYIIESYKVSFSLYKVEKLLPIISLHGTIKLSTYVDIRNSEAVIEIIKNKIIIL